MRNGVLNNRSRLWYVQSLLTSVFSKCIHEQRMLLFVRHHGVMCATRCFGSPFVAIFV
jgi:hypothetical protein